jgi:hypothetical protein
MPLLFACAAALSLPSTRRGLLHATASALVLPQSAAMATSLDSVYDTRALDQMPVVEPSKFKRLDSGVRYADLRIGEGTEVNSGSRLSIQWVLRRSNGYYVDGSVNTVLNDATKSSFDPFVFIVGEGKALPCIDEGIRGMRQGGVRRLVCPVAGGTAYTSPVEKSAGPVPQGFGPRRQIERELAKQDPYNYVRAQPEDLRLPPTFPCTDHSTPPLASRFVSNGAAESPSPR